MYLNFKCPACDNEIQAEYQHIGEWVACPLCSFAQVVPDPQLPSGASYNGYSIDRLVESNLLCHGYRARGGDEARQGALSLLRIPTSFFLKNISDFESFSHATVSCGSLNVEGMARLVDKSLIHGKTFFVYDLLPDSRSLASFISIFGPLKPGDASELLRKAAASMGKVWHDLGSPHLGLSPAAFMVSPVMDLQIFDYGISKHLLRDPKLMASGFNIWDLRYMSPESRSGAHDFNSPASDIYSLGAIVHFMLTGKDPFGEDEFDSSTPFPEMPLGIVLPDPFRALIRKMTAFSPADRFHSWEELSSAVDRMCSESGLPLQRAGERRVVRQFPRSDSKPAEELRSDPVGLTHTNIKFDKKLKLHASAPKKKPQMGETIAKLSPRAPSHASAHSKGSGSGAEKMLVLLIVALVSAIGLLILFVFYFLNKGQVQDSKAPGSSINVTMKEPAQSQAQPAAPAKSKGDAFAPLPPGQAPTKAKIYEMLRAADEYAASNPEAYNEILKRYELAANYSFEIKDFSLMDVTRDKINAIMDRRRSKIEDVIRKLDAAAEPLVNSGSLDAARKLYLDYDGAYAAESKEKRVLAADKLVRSVESGSIERKGSELESAARKLAQAGRFREAISHLEAYDGDFAAETAQLRKKLADELKKASSSVLAVSSPLIKKLIPLIARLESAKASAEIKAALKEPSSAPAAAQLESVALSLDQFSSLDVSFLEGLKSSLGKTANLSLSGRKPDDYKVLEVKQGSASVKAGEQPPLSISFKDLTLDSKIAFAAKQFNLDENTLLCALIGIQSSDKPYFKEMCSKLPLGMDILLPAELKEIEAKVEFEAFLESSGLPFDKSDYSTILPQMLKKDFQSSVAVKMLASLDDFLRRFEGAKFVEAHKGLIDNIDRNCRRSGASVAQRAVVDPDYLKKNSLTLADVMEKAQQSAVIELKKGVYSNQGGAPLVVFKNGLRLIGEEGVEFEGGLKIMADKATVSKIVFRKGRLDIVNVLDVKIDSCAFLGHGSAIKNSSKVLLENSIVKGLFVNGSKDVDLNHCTLVGSSPIDDKVNASLLFMGDELAISNCVLSGEMFAISVSNKAEKRKFSVSSSVLYGEAGLCAELMDTGVIAKNIAKSESGLKKFLKSSRNVLAPVQFVAPSLGDFSLVKDTPGTGAASDGKDCGSLLKVPPPQEKAAEPKDKESKEAPKAKEPEKAPAVKSAGRTAGANR